VKGHQRNVANLPTDVSVEGLTDPLHGVLLGDTVGDTDAASLGLLLLHVVGSATEHDEEVHTVNASLGIVLEAKVDMLVDAETEVSGLGEVLGANLVVRNLEATLDQVHGLVAADGDVARNLLVTTDTEGTHSVASDGLDRGLVGQLLQHADRLGEPVARLANSDVDDELVAHDLAHTVIAIFLVA